MSDMKQVKVDNWGIYFLQRLKHFFNRTDYCDLTLQFQDNAQLKVHRLVLNACTEYFELLERTCEMYEDCLVMPDDLQADVVVPIVNFMYTGQLGFKPELLERLYQTAQVMNMPVLTKLLDAHRNQMQRTGQDYQSLRSYSKSFEAPKPSKAPAVASTSYMSTKRSYSKAFDNTFPTKVKKQSIEKSSLKSDQSLSNETMYTNKESTEYPAKKKPAIVDSRPTRYELPEELDGDNIFDNSFTSISYESTPLMVHPETVKRYSSKKSNNIFEDTSSTKRLLHGTSTLDIVECKKLSSNENIFDDVSENVLDDAFSSSISKKQQKDSNQLFDLILDNDNTKSTIEIKDSETKKPKIDHAKIISDVLKKYPHLVKSNKNIKLRVLDAPVRTKKSKTASLYQEEKDMKTKVDHDWTLDIDVLDSKGAAKLIAMGVDNVKGPWICLICGTPGRALHFSSYYKFRRHLVEVHNEKPVVNMCEYCGLKAHKRNYLLHHMYTKHGVPPPSPYYFPKCNQCSYIALSEALLVKHKVTQHEEKTFACNVCASTFSSSTRLLTHIQATGHKYSADRKTILHCIYCFKTFSRETNLYSHLKYNHKQSAQSDKIIEESDDEKEYKISTSAKSEKTKNISLTYTNEYENIDVKYQIQQKPDGNIQVLTKVPQTPTSSKHKILNPSFSSPIKSAQKSEITLSNKSKPEICEVKPSKIINKEDEIVVINGNEYIIKENHLIPRSQSVPENEEYMLSNVDAEQSENNSVPTTSMEFPIIHHTNSEDAKMIIKKPIHVNEPIEIVVSSEEQYKALMSSTHSIIFEEPNKTLTVLTAPQTSTLEATTIDLDNTQSNDMMIIQENYPLNVSETVSADNNNIVVVYSHQMDDPSKQFQYIQSQGIEAQFIQSSPMVTQNYGTVTTSAPVMSVHALDTNVNEPWQNNLKENTERVPIQVQLQEHIEINNSNAQQLIEEPQNSSDIQSTADVPTSGDLPIMTTDMNTIEETNTQTCIENTNSETVSMDQVLLNEVPSAPTTTAPQTDPSELVHKEIQTESIEIVCSSQSDVSENNVKNVNNGQLNIVADKNNENIIVLQQKVEEIDINSDVNTTTAQDTSVIQQSLITEEELIDNGPNIVEVPTNNAEATATEADKELPDLTAEWTAADKEKLIGDDVDNNITGGSAYIEESIENIQQEMAKQLEAITTENHTMQYSEPLTMSTTSQPDLQNESVIKELETEKKSSNLGLDDSEVASEGTETKMLVLPTKDQGTPESLPTTLESPPTDNIQGSSITTDNVETASENIIQDNVCEAVSEINSENVADATNVTPSPVQKEIVNVNTDKKINQNTTSVEENVPKPQQRPVVSLNNKAREKINTILNDWDDNDDQDDIEEDLNNESEFIGVQNNDEIVQEVEMVPEDNVVQTEPTPVKVVEINNDKIKSLVSDWDDDDDDDDESK